MNGGSLNRGLPLLLLQERMVSLWEDFLEQLEILAASCAAGMSDIPKDTKKAVYWRNILLKTKHEFLGGEKP